MKKIILMIYFMLTPVITFNEFEMFINQFDGDAKKIVYALAERPDLLNYYNNLLGNENSITGVESIKEIVYTSRSGNSIGYLSDFIEDEGYYLLLDNNIIVDWEADRESPFIGVEDEYVLFYNEYTGYYYEDIEGEEYSVTNGEISMYKAAEESYDGQYRDATGCGKIVNVEAYLEDRYGTGYELETENTLDYSCKYNQDDLSAYFDKKGNGEGNCGIISVYNALQAMQSVGLFARMEHYYQKDSYLASVSEPKVYKKYMVNSSDYIDITESGQSWPKLYINTRLDGIDINGKPEDLSIYQSATLMEKTAKRYDYKINCVVKLAFRGNTDKILNNIDSFQASLFSTAEGTYPDHTMCVTGYKTYVKRVEVNGVINETKILFFETSDGHLLRTTFYDISSYEGKAAIVYIK